MENYHNLDHTLQNLEKYSRRQLRCARLQLLLTGLAALCCGGVLLLGLSLTPQLQDLLVQLETVLGNLEQVSGQLAGVDLAGMAQNMDTLVTESGEALTEAMDKLNRVDFDALNKAIESLSGVVESLSRLTRLFG